MTVMNKTVRVGAKNLRKRGDTYLKIGNTFKVSTSTAWRWTKIKEKDYAAKKETRGRPKSLSEAKVKQVQKRIKKLQADKKKVTVNGLKSHYNLTCSPKTIKSLILEAMGQKWLRRSRKPGVPKAQRERREAFAKALPDDGKATDHIHVVFDNYDPILPIPSRVDRDAMAWMDPKERMLPHNCADPKANKGPMLHFLPIIAVKGGRGGKGKLLACPQYKTMNTNTAYELFKDVMIPAVKKHYRGKGIKKFYICCDGATAFNNLDKVKPLLKKHGFEIAFRGQNKRNPPAPGQLSDFYPIENINADRKRALRDAVNASKRWRDGVGTTKENLKDFAAFAKQSFEELSPDTIANCFASWDDRRKDLIAAEGGPTDW